MVPVELTVPVTPPRHTARTGGNSMVKAIEKVFTFFIVVILILLLLDLLGGFIANSVPEAAGSLSIILHNIWYGFVNIVHPVHPY
jgi:hypothetical protein